MELHFFDVPILKLQVMSSRQTIFVGILALSMFSIFEGATAASTPPEKVEMPTVQHVDGVTLKKNGHGVRSINFFGWDINVYMAGFYSAEPLLSETDVLKSHDSNLPMQLDFTFLRTVDEGRVVSAWTQQLDHSVSYKYDGFESDRDVFIQMFSNKIENGGTQTVQLVGDKTVMLDQGVHKGNIVSRDFQRAFLSMWFGDRAVAEDLKANLLSGAGHYEIEHKSTACKAKA